MIDPFAPEYSDPQDCYSTKSGERPAFSLFELNRMVSNVVTRSMSDTYWVAAEISELRVAVNGHCYLEFVQKDEYSGSLIAKARGNIWKNNFAGIRMAFERATGQSLTAGIKVLVCVSVAFHEMYGYSLTVLDIDPTYTLGDLERRRREILQQLEEDGVISLNKELPLPRIIRRVAVISSPTAAGYGDFCNQLEQSGFAFKVQLFPAMMQGDRVEQSVIAALDRIALEADQWDVVAIIRGGGASTDLNGFDTYLLAANIAQFPLPVLSGIGHERDETIVDYVAHTRLKTPTAVAVFLIDSRHNEVAVLHELEERMIRVVQETVVRERRQLDDMMRRFKIGATQTLADERRTFDSMAHRFELAATHYTGNQREELYKLSARLEVQLHRTLSDHVQQLSLYPQRLRNAVDRYFMQEQHRQELFGQSIKLAGPERILSLGFSMTLKNGKPVCLAEQLHSGDTITTLFKDGEVTSRVE